jgi:hypothetical protein
MQMNGMLFMIAVSGTALICYWLMTRAENRSARRRPVGADGSGDGASYDSGGDGWHVARWFGGDNFTSDSSGPSGDSGGGDSGAVEAVTAAVVGVVMAVAGEIDARAGWV